MIGSLMYLTSSRPDIMFAVCACARFQVTPKVSQLHVVKRIFRYLKGKLHLGLWYPKDSFFNLVAYSDSDYVGASLNRKSTTGVLIKAQQHISNESPLLEVNTPRCDEDNIKLKELMVFMVVVSEAIIRRNLHLDDADGVKCLPNEEIFVELARIAKRTAWNEFSCFRASAVICLATGRKFNFSKYIFDNMVRNVDSPSKFLMYPRFLQIVMDNQVDDMTSPNTIYTSPALTQKVFANMRRVGKGFLGVETYLFASLLVQPQPQAEEEVEMPISPAPPSPTTLEILQLKERVKKLEKKKKSKSSWRMHPNRGKIESIDTDERITLVDVETQEEVVAMDAEPQGRLNQEDVSVAEPTVFDDEEVTMKMAQTSRDRQEKADMERALELQRQYDDKEENIDWNAVAEKIQERHLENIRKYQNLKKKLVSIAQARKNIIIYLKNMAGYKMEHFRGMTYDKVRLIFEREYKMVQIWFKLDKDVKEPKKKRVADETLLQESFKKLKAVEVSGSESTQEILSNDPKEMSEEDIHNMLEIVPVLEFKVEALQVKYPIIDWEIHSEGFDREDLVALWNLVKEKFSSAVPSEDKEKALWVELKRLFEPDAYDVEEDNEMARDLVIKIFMKANKPKSKSLDTSSSDKDA
uniref:Uncharacterized mitochondrial protein AtMg00810-like n=1 Tax=Tanacetum cinerariifolium TaxID=118510 RepID=A0A699GR30_TANCI|nr:uncharacterized mitochondrial protein AtMg00810-like [Tanacetum cinerariifolium]